MTQKVRRLVISASKTTCVEIFYSARFPYEKAPLFAMAQKVRELVISAPKMTCVEIFDGAIFPDGKASLLT